MAGIDDACPGNQTRHDRSGDEIANKIADHFRHHAAALELYSVLLDARRPNFPEEGHVPNGADNPVSCRRTNYYYPVHDAGCLNARCSKQDKIRRS